MKCEIAHDLLTLYAEDLCSPETATELEAHLATCESCAKKLEEYKSNIAEQLSATSSPDSDTSNEIKPLKKIRRKLTLRKWLAIGLALILIVLLCIIGVLSYGQITNRCMNFSSLADIYKLNQVTKAYAAGDSQPLVDILSFTFDEIYAFEKTTDSESFDEYKIFLKERLDAFYEKELEGKKITIDLNSTYNDPYEEMYSIDTPTSTYCYRFYDQDYNVLFSIDFSKLGPNKYCLSDYSSYSEKNIFNEEITDYLLPTEELITNVLLSYPAKDTYAAQMSGDSDANPARYFATHIRYYNVEKETEKAAHYQTALEKKITALYDTNIYFTDVLFSVDTFDAKSGYWIYKVLFQIENQENGKECVLESYFRMYDYRLYVIPDTKPTIIGEEALSEAQIQQLITLFDI